MKCYEATFAGIPDAAVPVEPSKLLIGALYLAQAARKAEFHQGDLGENTKIELTDKVIL